MTGLTTFSVCVTPSWLRRYRVCKSTDKISVLFNVGDFQQKLIFLIISSPVVVIYVPYINGSSSLRNRRISETPVSRKIHCGFSVLLNYRKEIRTSQSV